MRPLIVRPDSRTTDVLSANTIDLRGPREGAAAPSRPRRSWRFSIRRPASPQVNLAVDSSLSERTRSTPEQRPRRAAVWPRFKPVTSFAALAVGSLVPVLIIAGASPLRQWRARVVVAASAGFQTVRAAGQALGQADYATAAERFGQAQSQFSTAQETFNELQGVSRTLLLNVPVAGQRLADAERLLAAGQELATLGEEFTRLLERVSTSTRTASDGVPLAGVFLRESATVGALLHRLREVIGTLGRVDAEAVPTTYRDALRALQESAPALDAQLADAERAVPALAALLGSERPQELLVAFLNDAELRPGGGFLGSLALVRVERGAYQVLDAPGRGPFAINDLLPKTIMPPAPLLGVAATWTFQDANWFADVPTSARSVARFYEQARGFPVDGIVFLTPAVVERLLALTGPLPLPAYDVVLTRDNVRAVLQEQVEIIYDRQANQPKQIIVDLIPAVLERLGRLDPQATLGLLSALEASSRAKDLTVWSRDEVLQSSFQALGWSGALSPVSGDTFGLVEANLGGGKTSRALERAVRLEVVPVEDAVERTVTVTIRHAGDPNNRWTGTPYRGYVKIALPAGTQLLDVSGFDRLSPAETFTPPLGTQLDPELLQLERGALLDETSGVRRTEEFGRTVFGGWLRLAVGETRQLTLRASTPNLLIDNPLGSRYDLSIVKQPGAQPYALSVVIGGRRPVRITAPAAGADGATPLLIEADARFAAVFR